MNFDPRETIETKLGKASVVFGERVIWNGPDRAHWKGVLGGPYRLTLTDRGEDYVSQFSEKRFEANLSGPWYDDSNPVGHGNAVDEAMADLLNRIETEYDTLLKLIR